MMYYVDSNVLISYVFSSEEPFHTASRTILENLASKRNVKLYASGLTLVEICSVICRKIIRGGSKLVEPLQSYVDSVGKDMKEKCRLIISMIISLIREKLGVEFIDDKNLYDLTIIDIDGIKISKIFREAIELSYKINIRVKDLLHLTYAYAFSNTYGIKFFLTHDIEDFEKIKDEIKKLLQIDIVLIKVNI